METIRRLPGDAGIYTVVVLTGINWNVGGTTLLNFQIPGRLTDPGLNARFRPILSVNHAIGFN